MHTLLLCWMALSAPAEAHDPNIATFELTERGHVWWLEASFPQLTVDRALEAWLGEAAVAAMSETERKEAAVAYLKRTTRIEADGVAVPLGAGGIRLDGHQTDLRLSLPSLPEDARALSVTLGCFTETGRQYNVLRVSREGPEGPEILDRRVLGPDYGFTEHVTLEPASPSD